MGKRFGTLAIPVIVAAPSAPTVTPQGTPASTTVAYKVVALTATGHSAASSAGQTTTSAATNTEVDFNRLVWTAVTGATGYEVWRTTGGATQGLIATLGAVLTLDDTGLVADGTTAPAANVPGAGASADVAELEGIQTYLHGTFVGTVQLQVSADGTNFCNYGANMTSATEREITAPAVKAIRYNISAYTSGAPIVLFGGDRR